MSLLNPECIFFSPQTARIPGTRNDRWKGKGKWRNMDPSENRERDRNVGEGTEQSHFSPGCFEPRDFGVMGKDIYQGKFLKDQLALTILLSVKNC